MSTEELGFRAMRYSSRSTDQAAAWQQDLRHRLRDLLAIDYPAAASTCLSLDPETVSTEQKARYCMHEMEFSSTQGRRIKAILTIPSEGDGPFPAVVCIHGHAGHRGIVYDPNTIYRGFGNSLASRGYVTISADVGQHEVYEQGQTLMGERLWDLIRCVDYLATIPEVDCTRVGCGGLSLGGEMAMWLGAMDERTKATASSGFLTTMDQLEQHHCKCWKFPGLRELVDFADIYSLTAPRPLHCQNGRQELPIYFDVSVAEGALAEIEVIYRDFGQPDNLEFVAHDGGHDVDLAGMNAFFEKHLGGDSA